MNLLMGNIYKRQLTMENKTTPNDFPFQNGEKNALIRAAAELIFPIGWKRVTSHPNSKCYWLHSCPVLPLPFRSVMTTT
jgi:hypothetical protein